MSIGFTGTRYGMTSQQLYIVNHMLLSLPPITKVRHGDCIGADEQFHKLAIEHGHRVVIHPPDKEDYRAFCTGAELVYGTKPYEDRNYDIVIESDSLLATPNQGREIKRSGTWMTVRMARREGKPIVIVYPSGRIEHDY